MFYKHFAAPRFWSLSSTSGWGAREIADKNYELLKADSKHPSLHFKKIGMLWSVSVGAHYRALGLDKPEGVVWFWIGSHADYDKLIS